MTKQNIERTGLPPLRFIGMPVGNGSTRGTNSNRWTNVRIFVTQGGKWVASIVNRTQWEGEHDYAKAQGFETPKELIKFLSDDEGLLGRASQEACEAASSKCPDFSTAFVENID